VYGREFIFSTFLRKKIVQRKNSPSNNEQRTDRNRVPIWNLPSFASILIVKWVLGRPNVQLNIASSVFSFATLHDVSLVFQVAFFILPVQKDYFCKKRFIMKKLLIFTLLTIMFSLCFSHDADAQRRRRGKKKKHHTSRTDEYFDESGDFFSKLWYGAGFNLGFSGSGQSNTFFVGVSPMVGYKLLNGNLSVGPRVAVDYLSVKGRSTDAQIHRVNTANFSVAGFVRYKIISTIFAHVEVEEQSTKLIPITNGLLIYDPNDRNVITFRDTRTNVYVGGGYTSSVGGLWGYEVLFLYNLNQSDDSIDLPINFRVGVTYKF